MINKFFFAICYVDTWQNIGLKNNKIRMSFSDIEKEIMT